MKYFTLFTLLLFFCITISAQQKSNYPKPIGFINDYEHDFSKAEIVSLDLAVKDLLSKAMEKELLKGVEIAIVTVTDSMYGDEKEMSDYAMKLGEHWGVGIKGGNTGIIIAISRRLHKFSIATGPGLDTILADAAVQKIVDERMGPELKKGKYYDGLLAGIKGIKDALGL